MDGWRNDGWMDGCMSGDCRSSDARGMDELIYFSAMRLVARSRSRSASVWERTKDDVDAVASRSSRAFFSCDAREWLTD